MADTTVTPTPAPKRRLWLRLLILIPVILIVLLVIVYFVGTSSAFLKGVILPRVSKSINAEVTVSDASISPFKEVVLRDLKVQTPGEPLVTAPEVHARYSLMDILHGNIHVDEVKLTSPTVVVIENPDGTHNYDPLLKSQKEKPKEEARKEAAKSSKPTEIDVRNVSLTDATIRQVKIYKGGNRDVLELSHVNVTFDGLKNGQTGKLAVKANIKMDNNPPAPQTNGMLEAGLDGNFTFTLSPDLKPTSIQGKARLAVAQATGALADVAKLGAELDCDVTPSEIKQVALRFNKESTPLGELRVSGPLDPEKLEGKLNVQILSIDKQVLNLAGAKSGIDFGTTVLNSTNQIELAKGGTAVTTVGTLDLGKLQITREKQITPPLEFRAEYNVTVDRTAQNALLRSLTLLGTERGNPMLRAELTSPMTLAWGNVTNAVGDSALTLTVTHFNLADWKPFVGDMASSGDVNLKLTLLSQQAGKKVTFDLDSHTDNLTAGSGSNQISQASVLLQARGQAADLKQFNLTDYKLQVSRQNEPMVSMSGSGTYDTAAQTADLQVTAQLLLARLLQLAPQPDVNISSGTAELKAHVVQTTKSPGTTNAASTRNITGALTLTDFTGRYGSNNFQSFGSTMDLDVGMTPQQVQVRKLSGKLTQGPNPGGSFDVTATYDLSSKAAQFTAKLVDFNQNGLRPFLEPMLADKKLVSVGINANASGQYNPTGDSAVKADLQMANLVVNDPKGQFPAKPLEAKMRVDASVHNQLAEVRQFQIGLTPTDRAKNEIQLQGKVDMSKTNATQGHIFEGNLKVLADSIDVTSYYDLFVGDNKGAKPASAAGGNKTPGQPVASTASSPAQNPAQTEPAPKQLPLTNFTATVNIGRFYLREVEITNLQTTAKVDGGRVSVKPVQLVLNGAPVKATVQVNLGVPGMSYDVGFDADDIPFAPLVNSFEPERRGELKGALTAHTQISGTGTSGASLQKTLTGQFNIGTTNLELAIPKLRSPFMKTVVNVIAVVPTLLKNPTAAVGSLASSLLGGSSGAGGTNWVNDLQQSPIEVIQARGSIGSGKVDIQQALVQSAAFQAETRGSIPLAEVFTNSALNPPQGLPLTVSVRRGLAESINMVPAGTPTNATFVKLPDYVMITGTIGNPKEKINKTALLGTALQQVGGNIPGVNKQTGSLIQGLGGLLTGRQQPADTNAPAATNQPPAQSPVNSLLNQLLKPKK